MPERCPVNPYVIGAVVIAAALALAGAGGEGYVHGRKNGKNEVQVKWDEANAKQIIATQKEIADIQTRLTAASADLEKARNEKQIVYRDITKTVTKLVQRDVYRNVCLDPDGLRVINAAFSGTAAAAPADSAVAPTAVPAALPADGNNGR
jgi:hypothetical protein